MTFEEELININLENVKTLEAVSEVIRKIQNDNDSMKPFAFEINKELQNVIIGQLSEKGTIFGVPFKTVDRIDKAKVKEVIVNIKPKKYMENNRCFTPEELKVYTEGSHKFTPSMAIFVLSEIERYIERIEKELVLE